MNSIFRAILEFDDRIDEAVGQLDMVVEDYHQLNPVAWQRLQQMKDGLKQASLDLQQVAVALMITETAI